MAAKRERGEIIPGAGSIIDHWLGLDETWSGSPPRYQHKESFDRLCVEGPSQRDGLDLVKRLYNELATAWHGTMATAPRSTGSSNWRFKKRPDIAPEHPGSEVTLERAIVQVTDSNWTNQSPTLAGVLDAGGRACNLDLIHREGTAYTFIELKVADKGPLYAAMESLQYGIVYLFSRVHAVPLRYDANQVEVLRATAVHLRVLAPAVYFPDKCGPWTHRLQTVLSDGIATLGNELLLAPLTMDFAFERFPIGFEWSPEQIDQDESRTNLLWALHQRKDVFG